MEIYILRVGASARALPIVITTTGLTSDTVYTNLRLCLIENDTVYVIPTKLSNRDDIETAMGDGIDYHCSDFTAKVPKKHTHLLEKSNLGIIMISPDGENSLYEINDKAR